MSSVPETGVSHNPEIKKRVLAGYLRLPHITQVCTQYSIDTSIILREGKKKACKNTNMKRIVHMSNR